ncbi:MAG TPA: fused MFS/spermidine synthase, partial [Gemmatimonas sp.]|nr:fused MFS/spermidine synthase [Gemmatimonas sp.]
CPPKTNVILGDARLTLASQPAAAYDMLVLDAFSSDAIPVHLLTREAFALYDRVLAQRGVLAVHVSNRHLDLEPIVASLASNAGHVARVRGDTVLPTGTLSTGRTAAIWILVARAEEDLGTITINARWTGLRAGGELWTDDFSNVLRVLR